MSQKGFMGVSKTVKQQRGGVMVRNCLVFLIVLCSSTVAWAETAQISYEARGGFSVEVTISASETTNVEIPAGTMISSGDPTEQRFLIAETIERTVEAGQAVRVTVSAYCMDPHLSGPMAGTTMAYIGEAKGDMAALVRVAAGSTHTDFQQAVWSLSRPDPNLSHAARQLLSRAGLTPK